MIRNGGSYVLTNAVFFVHKENDFQSFCQLYFEINPTDALQILCQDKPH